jgi:hypothetical protein
MITINNVNVRHRKHKKGRYLHRGRIVPPATDKQLMAALTRQYRVTSANVKDDTLHVQVDDKVAA